MPTEATTLGTLLVTLGDAHSRLQPAPRAQHCQRPAPAPAPAFAPMSLDGKRKPTPPGGREGRHAGTQPKVPYLTTPYPSLSLAWAWPMTECASAVHSTEKVRTGDCYYHPYPVLAPSLPLPLLSINATKKKQIPYSTIRIENLTSQSRISCQLCQFCHRRRVLYCRHCIATPNTPSF